jgi:thiol-disulfide isomerase/thioredoxin
LFWRQVVASKQAEEETASSARSFAAEQGELFSTGFSFSGYERDLLALNLGEAGFLDVSGVSGADSITDGRGSIFADFDNDGDLDIFLRAMHGPAHLLLRNNIGQDSKWIRITLRGTTSGPDAYGAVVQVKTADGIRTKLLSGGSGFLSQSDRRLLFGLGDQDRVDSIEVTWPSGQRQSLAGAPAGTSLLIVEGEGSAKPLTEVRGRLPDPLTAEDLVWRQLKLVRGAQPPPVTVLSADGEVPLAGLLKPGRPALINFWATTCMPCRAEMPELEKLHREAGDAGLQVIGVSLDDPVRKAQIPALLAKLQITYPNFSIDATARSELFATADIGIPLSVYLDREHRATAVFQGWSTAIRRRIETLAAE